MYLFVLRLLFLLILKQALQTIICIIISAKIGSKATTKLISMVL